MPAIFITGNQCAPKQEEKFNKWYNEIHIPMLLKSRHLLGVTRYKLSSAVKGDLPNYLTVYEFKDSEALEAWFSGTEVSESRKEREETWAEDNFVTKLMAAYEPVRVWRKQPEFK